MGSMPELLVEKGARLLLLLRKGGVGGGQRRLRPRKYDPCREPDARGGPGPKLDAGRALCHPPEDPHEGTTTFHDAIFGDITVENDTLDDQVLIKRDGLPTYNFANVIDDHLMGITHVVRGSEYLSSAPKYNLLYRGLRLGNSHLCPLLPRRCGTPQNKMSKRHGDPSYEDLKAQGYLTEAIVNYVALLGWSPQGRAGRAGDLHPAGAGQGL